MNLMRAWIIVGIIATTVVANAQRARPQGDIRPNPAQNQVLREPILQKLMQARGRLRFSGTRTVMIKVDGDRLRVVEHVLRDGFRQRTEFADGSPNEGQIIVEDEQRRQHYFPGRNEILILPPRADEIYGRFRRQLREVSNGRLKFKSGPGGVIAGVPTEMGEIVDQQGNPVQRFWIDMRTGMMLKRELYDPVGGMAGAFEFTRINYEPVISRGDFELVRRGAKLVSPSDLLQQVSQQTDIRPMRLPESSPYKLEDVRPLDLPNGTGMIQVYTGGDDGRFSFFIVRGNVDPQRLRRLLGQSLNFVAWRKGDLAFALMGDLPKRELDQIADQLGR